MRTEYDFTEAQKAELKKIDDQIEQLNRQIFDLCMERERIYMQARGRYIFDTDELYNVYDVYTMAKNWLFDKPLIPHDDIVKIIFDEKEEE